MSKFSGRALHYVFKIPDRKKTMDFYRKILGMKVLRHEEFKEGCEAQCNGAYDGRWSKTMIGYGPEDSHFVIELTYNYGVSFYDRGNDFIGIEIQNSDALRRAKELQWPILDGNVLEAPGGYKFFITDKAIDKDKDPVTKVILASSDLSKSKKYWHDILGLKLYVDTAERIEVGFQENQAKLELRKSVLPIDRKQAYGRIAFSIPHAEQEALSALITESQQKILTPLITLPTPGKADVRVIILADPDNHEICFVDDEPFRELSKVDYESEQVLDIQIKKDKS